MPLYAADSAFTHELTREAVDGHRRQASVLRAFAPDVLARASAERVLALLAEKPEWQGERVAPVLAAHGTVLNPPRPIDAGLVATEALCNAIRTQLAGHFGMVVNGSLNHTVRRPWTEPPIEVALERVVAAGFTKVVYYPYGFLGDNAESELEGRLALLQQPTLAARHLPCLNDSTLLLDLVARQLRQCAAACAGAATGGLSSRAGLCVMQAARRRQERPRGASCARPRRPRTLAAEPRAFSRGPKIVVLPSSSRRRQCATCSSKSLFEVWIS